MRTDRTLRFRDAKIHEAVQYALTCLLRAQYPNGAWPQGYDRFPEPEDFPVKPAAYPESWSRAWPGSESYWRRYTLNDNALATAIETMFVAHRIYGPSAPDPDLERLATRCRAAAEKAGGFLLLAQMPEPQPAWAQQYDFDLQPAWARKFEPPAITGGESQGVLRTLLALYRETRDDKYLERDSARAGLPASFPFAGRESGAFLRIAHEQASLFHDRVRADLRGPRPAHALRVQSAGRDRFDRP